MIIECRNSRLVIDGKVQPPGVGGVLVKADTGERIPFASYANTETGEYRALEATPDGKAILVPPKIIIGKCPIRFEKNHSSMIGSPSPVVRRQVEPSKINPEASIAEIRAIARDWGFTELVAVPEIECEYPGCHKMAMFQTGDEQIIEPSTDGAGNQFERAFTTRVHKYCSNPKHWRPPVRTSLRKVQEEVEVTVRPKE